MSMFAQDDSGNIVLTDTAEASREEIVEELKDLVEHARSDSARLTEAEARLDAIQGFLHAVNMRLGNLMRPVHPIINIAPPPPPAAPKDHTSPFRRRLRERRGR